MNQIFKFHLSSRYLTVFVDLWGWSHQNWPVCSIQFETSLPRVARRGLTKNWSVCVQSRLKLAKRASRAENLVELNRSVQLSWCEAAINALKKRAQLVSSTGVFLLIWMVVSVVSIFRVFSRIFFVSAYYSVYLWPVRWLDGLLTHFVVFFYFGIQSQSVQLQALVHFSLQVVA